MFSGSTNLHVAAIDGGLWELRIQGELQLRRPEGRARGDGQLAVGLNNVLHRCEGISHFSK